MSEANRRHFIKTTTATAAALASRGLELRPHAQGAKTPAADPMELELANEALNVARGAGASYADVRVGRYRQQNIQTRELQVTGVSDDESYGLGIRTLVNGCWGFAATSTMTRDGIQKAAREAVAIARAARSVQRHPVELASAKPVTGTWMTPVERDPIEVPLEEKIALLLKANGAALRGEAGAVRLVRTPAAARNQDTGDVGRHKRYPDVRSCGAIFCRDGDGARRFSDLRT